VNSKLVWYAARSNGLVAWGLLALSVFWGLALSTKIFGKRARAGWLLDLHRFLGGTALIFTAIHVAMIMLDRYVHFTLLSVLVPLTGTWHPDAVAWGIVAMYLLVAVEVTSLIRRRIGKATWRRVHYLSFPLLAVASTHAMTAGTDRHTALMRWTVYLVTGILGVLTLARASAADNKELMGSRRELEEVP
jgi:hypothetical protein